MTVPLYLKQLNILYDFHLNNSSQIPIQTVFFLAFAVSEAKNGSHFILRNVFPLLVKALFDESCFVMDQIRCLSVKSSTVAQLIFN